MNLHISNSLQINQKYFHTKAVIQDELNTELKVDDFGTMGR